MERKEGGVMCRNKEQTAHIYLYIDVAPYTDTMHVVQPIGHTSIEYTSTYSRFKKKRQNLKILL